MQRIVSATQLEFPKNLNWISLIADLLLVGMVLARQLLPFWLRLECLCFLGLRTSFISWVIMCVRNPLWG